MSKTVLLGILILAVCTAVVIVHWPALSAQALSFDDNQYLADNELVKSPSLASAWLFLSQVLEPSTVGGYYQPLAMISLMLDYSIGGRVDNLMPFHRTSLALHAANTALIILLLYLLFGQAWIAAAVGLLFGLHPMTVEPIPWVGERKTLLAAFFALWCLILYVRYAEKKNSRLYIGCFILYLLALMSKPTSTPLPLLMLLLDFWPLKQFKWRSLFEKIPFFALGGISAIITYISQTGTAASKPPIVIGRILFTICHDIVFYLYKIVWPANLSSHYPFPDPLNLSQPMVLAGVIGTCTLIPLLIISLRWTRAAFTGWLFFFLAILPTMQIVGFSNVIASDKFAYLPSVGLLMILTSLLIWFCSTVNSQKPVLRYAAVIVTVLAAGSAQSVVVRNYLVHWRNSVGLYEYMISLAPKAPSLHNGLGVALQSEGRLDEAIAEYRQSLKFGGDFSDTYYNIGNALRDQGKLDEAIVCYRQVLKIYPYDIDIYNNLGIIFQSQGRLEEAAGCFSKILQIKPDNAKAHYNLGMILQWQDKPEEAIDHFYQALKANPNDANSYFKLGVIVQSQGRLDEAIGHYSKAIHIRPIFPEAHNNLAMLLAQQGKLDEAIQHYRQVLVDKPDDASAHNNLATAFMASSGRLDEAVSQLHEALRLDPNNIGAHCNLSIALSEQGKFAEAAASLERAAQLTNYQDADILAALAAAYASGGQTDKAVAAAQNALDIAAAQQNIELAEHIARQLAAYKLSKP